MQCLVLSDLLRGRGKKKVQVGSKQSSAIHWLVFLRWSQDLHSLVFHCVLPNSQNRIAQLKGPTKTTESTCLTCLGLTKSMLERALHKQLFNNDSCGASTTSLGSLFPRLSTFTVKIRFLMPCQTVPWHIPIHFAIISRSRDQHHPLLHSSGCCREQQSHFSAFSSPAWDSPVSSPFPHRIYRLALLPFVLHSSEIF